MRSASKGTPLGLLLLICLFVYWCQRIGCIAEHQKSPPGKLSGIARMEFLNKLAELKTDRAAFIQEGRAKNQILGYEVIPYIRLNVRRKGDHPESRYFYINYDDDKIDLSTNDFSPTGSLEQLCEEQTDSITIATTYKINDGPMQGDYLLARWTKINTEPRRPYGYFEIFNLAYLEDPLSYMFDSGQLYDCLKKRGILATQSSPVREEPSRSKKGRTH